MVIVAARSLAFRLLMEDLPRRDAFVPEVASIPQIPLNEIRGVLELVQAV